MASSHSPTEYPTHRSGQIQIIAIGALFIVFPVLAIGLRITSRRIARRSLDWSDGLLVAAGAVVLTYWALNISTVYHGGWGLHTTDIIVTWGMDRIKRSLQAQFAGHVLWLISGGLVKISLILLYCQSFTDKTMLRMAKAVGLFIILFEVAGFIAIFATCTPLAFNWDLSLPDGHCGSPALLYKGTGSLDVVTNVMVLALPAQYLWKLDLTPSRKWALLGTFALGVFTCTISIVRVASIATTDFNDPTFSMVGLVSWSGLEPSIAIIVASLPTWEPLLELSKNKRPYADKDFDIEHSFPQIDLDPTDGKFQVQFPTPAGRKNSRAFKRTETSGSAPGGATF